MTEPMNKDLCFLTLGFIPKKELDYNYLPNRDLIHEYKSKYKSLYLHEDKLTSLKDLENIAKNLFILSVQKRLEQEKDRLHVIPLSGGWDSRGLMAALIECVELGNICAITFGQAGNFDFETSRKICATLGIKNHILIDLDNHQFNIDKIIEFASRQNSPGGNILGSYIYDLMYRSLGKNCTVWSGFCAGTITGQRFLPSATWESALNLFIRQNAPKSILKCNILREIGLKHLPTNPILNDSSIQHSEQLELALKQPLRIGPSLLRREYHHLSYATPFLDEELSSFFFSLPRVYRQNQILYMQMLMALNAKLFKNIPLSRSLGEKTFLSYLLEKFSRKLQTLEKRKVYTSFMDFEEAFYKRNDFQKIKNFTICEFEPIGKNISELKINYSSDEIKRIFSYCVYRQAGKLN